MISREIERIQYLINQSIIKIKNTKDFQQKNEIHDKTMNYIAMTLLTNDVKQYFMRCLIKREIANYYNKEI